MSDFKVIVLFTKLGQLIGTNVSDDTTDGSIALRNPVMLSRTQNQMMFIPLLLDIVEEDTLVIAADEIIGQILTPKGDLRDHYTQMFSSIDLSASKSGVVQLKG